MKIDGKTGFIDRSGQFIIPPVLEAAQPFMPGFPYTAARQDGTFGVIDRTGAWKFRVEADDLLRAEEPRQSHPFGWHVQKGNRWGLLDLDGHVLLDSDYDQRLQRCEDGRLVVFENKEWLYFRSDGSPLQPSDGRLINSSCSSLPPYILKIGDKFGLVDGNGNAITPTTFEALRWIGKDLWTAKVDGKWGRIGADGHWVIAPKFETLSRDASIIVAGVDGKRGFLRPDGSWLIEPKFDAARVRDSETAFVTLDGATGILRLKDQSWAVPPRPGVMCNIPFGLMWQNGGHRALLSPNGDIWIDIAAERIGFRFEDGLLTFLKDGKWGVTDTAGQVIVQPSYDAPLYFLPSFHGVAWAKHDGHWCPIDRRGHQVDSVACVGKNPLGDCDRVFKCSVEP